MPIQSAPGGFTAKLPYRIFHAKRIELRTAHRKFAPQALLHLGVLR